MINESQLQQKSALTNRKLSLSIGAPYRVVFVITQSCVTTTNPVVHFTRMWRRHPTARHDAPRLERLEMEERRVKAIIFDLDNTLIETRRAGEVAIQKVRM